VWEVFFGIQQRQLIGVARIVGNDGPPLVVGYLHLAGDPRKLLLEARFRLRRQLGSVQVQEPPPNQERRLIAVPLEDEFLGLIVVEPEAARDQHKQANAEQEAALQFETRLAQHALEGSIGHGQSRQNAGNANAATPNHSFYETRAPFAKVSTNGQIGGNPSRS